MLYVILWLACGGIAASIYRNKGRSWAIGLIAGLLLGPIAVLLAAISGTDAAAKEQRELNSGSSQKCPHCAELIRSDAKVCRFCGRDVTVAALR